MTFEPADRAEPLGKPFRAEVPIADFEKIENTRRDVDTAIQLFSSYEDKPAAAQLVEEVIVDENTPNEAKMEAFGRTLALINESDHLSSNLAIGETLIDMIRAQKIPGMRVRLAGILSHDIQPDYIWNKWKSKDSGDDTDFRAAESKRFTFMHLAVDPSVDPVYRNWAKAMLEPKGVVKVFSHWYEEELQKADFDALAVIPKIAEEVTQISENEINAPEALSLGTLEFTGKLVKLHPNWLPSFDKMVDYQKQTGKPLPIFIVREAGKNFIAVEFPRDLSQRAGDLAYKTHLGEFSREDVAEGVRNLLDEFLPRMNPDQRREYEDHIRNGNVEIRFSTERSKKIPIVTELSTAA